MRDVKPSRIQIARRLRRDSTDAERRLWYRLRSRQVDGAKFVRQEPIGLFIVDFVCRERRLIIEVDGGQHATDRRDVKRDRWLGAQGYRVLTFWNHDVLANTEGVLESIAASLSETTSSRSRGATPHPDPLPAKRGEGARAACQTSSR